MTSNDDYVLQNLLENQMVDQATVDEASKQIQGDETVVDVLIRTGVLKEEDILSLLASVFGMEFVDITRLENAEELRNLMPGELAKKLGAVPIFKSGNTITIAISDPTNFDTLDSARYALGCDVEAMVAPKNQILQVMAMLYPDMVGDELVGDMAGVTTESGEEVEEGEGDAPIIRLCQSIIMKAFQSRASDIHIEPMEKDFRVRYRIDGVLRKQESPPKRLKGAIIQRFKLMAGMKLSEKRIPQDGRIQVNANGRELDLRVSTVPTNHGESIVMRILDKKNLALGLADLGMMSDDQQMFEGLIKLPDGVVLVTGPTGSGKTTTLYACLGQINLPDRKIITVEDPVEYQLTGINQVHVNPDVGMTFAAALRAILRQAPNIVMIGEIRDEETAGIALEVALTGHLVFSTLHTNDAPSAVTRLIDMGTKPFLVASALRSAMAQRLCRAICPECKQPYTPTDRELHLLGKSADELASVQLYRGTGCPLCGNSGYKGRKGVFEMFSVNEDLQRMIFESRTTRELRARARELGMRTLREDGIRKVLAGVTTIEEVLRVTMGDED